jgi:hypothetical protein
MGMEISGSINAIHIADGDILYRFKLGKCKRIGCSGGA